MKTPVSRVGNKTPILHILYSLFPLNYSRYVDVFGGSGSVLLGKPEVTPFEVYNDYDKNLSNLFQVMKTRPMALINELGFCQLNSRYDFELAKSAIQHEDFRNIYIPEEVKLTEILLPPPNVEELKMLYTRMTSDSDVARAAAFFKLLRYSYSSSGKSFACQPFDIRKLFDLIMATQERLSNVVIENQDFETLIKHYDRPETFFYLDPPYYSTEDMYDVGFGWNDHVRLRDTLSAIQGRFLLSYNDCEEIRSLYENYGMIGFTRPHTMAQRYEAGKEFKELLVANYDMYERERNKPQQLLLLDGDTDYEEIMKEEVLKKEKKI